MSTAVVPETGRDQKSTWSCPICLSVDTKAISENSGKQLRKCPHCGGVHLSPLPSARELLIHFVAPPGESEHELELQFERNRRRVLSRVAQYLRAHKRPGSILDVGCATGLFLSRFLGAREWRATGVDLSPRKAQRAARSGVNVFVGDTRQANFERASFDAVTVLDAFYYFVQPERELAEFHRILQEDGLLLLELPWANSRIWRRSAYLENFLTGNRVSLLERSDHLFYYTPKSISLLLNRCGFHVTEILVLPANRQRSALREGLWLTYSAVSRVVNFLSGSRICLGPRFLVAARKSDSPL